MPSPFRLDLKVWALRRRLHNVVDRWDGTCYRRTLVGVNGQSENSVRESQGPASPLLAVELRGSSPRRWGRACRREPVVSSSVRSSPKINLGGFYALAEDDERLRMLARRGSVGCDLRASRACSRPW